MNVWILDCDVDNYENLAWEKETDIEFIQSFDGTEKKEGLDSCAGETHVYEGVQRQPGAFSAYPGF